MMSMKFCLFLCALLAPIVLLSTKVQADQKDVLLDSYDCVIYPSVVAELASSAIGVLSNVNVERSQSVKRGEIIAQLESKAELAALELIQARVDSTLELEFRKANASHMERQFMRIDEPSTVEIFSREEIDERETNSKMGGIQLAQAKESKKFLKLELEQSKELLERRNIRSPFDGVVTKQLKYAGEFVDGDAVVEIAKLHPLHVETIIPAKHFGQIAAGMQATIYPLSYSSEAKYTAQVDRVDQVLDVASDTFGVRLRLENPNHDITAGLRCTLKFEQAVQLSEVAQPLPDDNYMAAEGTDVFVDYLDDAYGNDVALAVAIDEPVLEGAIEATVYQAVVDECDWPKWFESKADAEEEVRNQEALGVSLAIEKRSNSFVKGHSVTSPVFYDRSELAQYVETLRSGGVKDILLPRLSSKKPRVALGYFKNIEGANARMASIEKHGLEAETISWIENRDNYLVLLEEQAIRSSARCGL